MAKKRRVKKMAKKTDSSKINAFIATFLSIIGFIIAILVWKKDRYVMFYAKQSLVIFIGWIIAAVISVILNWVPFVGLVIQWILGLAVLVFWVISWVYALSGEMKDVPKVGDFAKKIKL